MQYIYVLDYDIPSRDCIRVDDAVVLDDKNTLKIIESYGHKNNECAWLVTNKKLSMDTHKAVVTKV